MSSSSQPERDSRVINQSSILRNLVVLSIMEKGLIVLKRVLSISLLPVEISQVALRICLHIEHIILAAVSVCQLLVGLDVMHRGIIVINSHVALRKGRVSLHLVLSRFSELGKNLEK